MSLRAAAALLLASLLAGGALRWAAASRSQGLAEFWQEWEYYGMGVELAESGTLRVLPGLQPTANRLPLYPAFIGVLRQTVPGPRAVRFAQAAFDTAAIGGVYVLGALTGGTLAAAAAAALYAVSGPMLGQVPELTLDCFFGWLVLLTALALALWAREPRSGRRAAAAGLALGLCLTCRSTLWLFPVCLVPAVFLAKGWRSSWRAALLFVAIPTCLLLPWSLRNLRVFHAFIPLENEAPMMAIWAASVGRLEAPTELGLIAERHWGEVLEDYHAQGETARRRDLWRRVRGNLLARPSSYAWECLKRIPVLWREQWPFLLLSFTVLLRRGHRAETLALLGLVLYFNVHLLMGVFPRFVRPVHGVLCVLAAVGAARFLRREDPPMAEKAAWGFLAAGLAPILFLYMYSSALLLREKRPEAPDSPGMAAAIKGFSDLGVQAAVRGRWESADEYFSEALSTDPGQGEALVSRGLARQVLGRTQDSDIDYANVALRLERLTDASPEARASRLRQY
ncbi:MAG: hypothetical protein A2X36_10255 [Elusimicrobia bacterium GWA2_69_24]|nr:MAG: hypothetical protein A2X36_10255 [Elusimicrobia bacterium GWA2_69_24]